MTPFVSNRATFFASQPDFFTDLNTLGADSRKGEFLDWKWAQATTADGRQLGIPIDIGTITECFTAT